MRGGDKMEKGRGGRGRGGRAQLLPDWISASDSLKLPLICVSTYSLTSLLKITASLDGKLSAVNRSALKGDRSALKGNG